MDSCRISAADDRRVRLIIFRWIIRDTIELLSSLCFLLPILILQAATVVHHPTTPNFVMFVGALFGNLLLLLAATSNAAADTLGRLNTGLLERFPDCRLIEHEMTAILSSSAYQEIVKPTERVPAFRLFSVVYPVGQSAPRQYCAYPLVGTTYIFCRDHPLSARGVAKFFVLHEIGHSDVLSRSASARPVSGHYLSAALAFWVATTCTVNISRLIGTLIVLYALMWIRRHWDLELEVATLHEEIQADNFALTLLSAEDRAALKRFLTKYRAPRDPRLSEEQNVSRDKILREGISYAEQGLSIGMRGVAVPPTVLSGSYGLLLVILGLVLPQHKSILAAVASSAALTVLAFALAVWASGVAIYRRQSIENELRSRAIVTDQ